MKTALKDERPKVTVRVKRVEDAAGFDRLVDVLVRLLEESKGR